MDSLWVEMSLREIIALLIEIRDLLKEKDDDKVIELLEAIAEKLDRVVELLETNNTLLTEVNETCQEILSKMKKK